MIKEFVTLWVQTRGQQHLVIALFLLLILALLLGGPLLMLAIAGFALAFYAVVVIIGIAALIYVRGFTCRTVGTLRLETANQVVRPTEPAWKREMRESGQLAREQELWDQFAARLQALPAVAVPPAQPVLPQPAPQPPVFRYAGTYQIKLPGKLRSDGQKNHESLQIKFINSPYSA